MMAEYIYNFKEPPGPEGYRGRLIRCKDCKHRYKEGEQVVINRCELNHNLAQSDDWFCADGERREDEQLER